MVSTKFISDPWWITDIVDFARSTFAVEIINKYWCMSGQNQGKDNMWALSFDTESVAWLMSDKANSDSHQFVINPNSSTGHKPW